MTEKGRIAKVVEQVPFSGIRKFFDIVNERKDIISLSVGEPDFQTPVNVREEGVRALRNDITKYTSNVGMIELRREVAEYMKRKHELAYKPQGQVLITVGSSEGLDTSMRAIINPGDEVLVIEPCYVSYKPLIMMAGGVPVVIKTKAENGFRLMPDELLEKITDKTKALLINYPTNPTGAIMERADLEKIADVLRDRDIIVVSDEIYGELTYGGRKHVSIAEIPGMYDKTVVLNGFSKAYAMTGWRLAYACGPEDIIQAMLKIHQYCVMSAPTISQYAGIEALKECDKDIETMRNAYDERRIIMLDRFRNMGMDCFEPLGAFYMFPSIERTGMKAEEFCNRLLDEAQVAVVPGNAFGDSADTFIRCSYAYSLYNIQNALDRIETFINNL